MFTNQTYEFVKKKFFTLYITTVTTFTGSYNYDECEIFIVLTQYKIQV
jgi:hypothetical protein